MVKGKATLVETGLSDEETLCRVTGNVYKALAFHSKNRHLIFKAITPLADFISPPDPSRELRAY